MMLFFPEFINSDCPILSGLVYHFQKGIYSFHPTNHTVRGERGGCREAEKQRSKFNVGGWWYEKFAVTGRVLEFTSKVINTN